MSHPEPPNLNSMTRLPFQPKLPRAGVVRLVSLALVGFAIAGMMSLNASTKQSADASPATSSAMTVKWLADNSAAAASQPARNPQSPHYNEMKNLSISVTQTAGLIDQAVSVSVKNFAVGTGTVHSPLGTQNDVSNAQNFLQAMQCWGEPSSANFRQSCEWGGRYTPGSNNGLGTSAFPDTTLRVGTVDIDPNNPSAVDNPFLTVQGRKVAGKPVAGEYEILNYFNAATSNEVTTARVGTDGTGAFDFAPQTADTAPQLGCGTEGHLRCWLVVVPRGTVFGGGVKCSEFPDPGSDTSAPYSPGQHNALQAGSPINPNCDYWENRVVVPLDFAPVGSTCAVGSAEQRVNGSQLMVGAMSSWQPDLCTKQKTTFNFSTNPDSVARLQLLEGQTAVAYSSQPLSAGEQTTNELRQTLASTKLSYSPVAVSGVAIAFLAESDGGRQRALNLSPRLVAKLFTQSYAFQIPSSTSDDVTKPIAHLTVPLNNGGRPYRYLSDDPEFKALNPDDYRFFSQNPSIVLPGPASADAIRQVWKWLAADQDAAAFLAGTLDPWGMGINPYYLPLGHPKALVQTFTAEGEYVMNGQTRALSAVGLSNIDGTPFSLAVTPLDTFPKSDRTVSPLKLIEGQKRPYDSIQFAPFAENLLSAARVAFRADPNSKSIWDPNKINQAGEMGDWVSSGAQVPGQKFMIAITDSPSAARYGLDIASIRAANGTSLSKPSVEGMSAALSALRPTSDARVTQVDPAAVVASGYPLTIVTYADVNLTTSTAVDRKAIANLISQVTTSGQVSGTEPGQLPAGYLPITADMAAQAAASVVAILAYAPVVTTDSTTDSTTPETGDYRAGNISAFNDAGGIANAGAAPAHDPVIVAAAAAGLVKERTASPASSALARSGLALSLGVGAAGVLFAPLLFKRRGYM